jgi:amphi-Trp domain-containing protein
METDRSFEFSAYCEPAQVADYLEALARYIRAGHAQLAVGSESIQLSFSPSLKLELAAKMRPDKGKGSLELDISWRRPPHFEEPLRIQAGENSSSGELEIGAAKRGSRSDRSDRSDRPEAD